MLLHVPRHQSVPVSGALELVVPHDSLWTPWTLQGWTTRAGTMPVRSTAGGIGARGSASTYVAKPTSIIGKPWTLVAIFQFNEAVTGNYVAGVNEAPGGSSWDRQIGRVGSTLAVNAYDTANRIATVLVGSGIDSLRTYQVVGTCDGRHVRIACNGVQGTEVAISNLGFAGYSSPEFCVGSSTHNSSVTSDHSMSLVALLPYADQNYVDLSANPWQIFKPHRARIYSFPTDAINILNFERSPIRGVARGVS